MKIESQQTVIDYHLVLMSRGFLKVGQRVRIRGGAVDGVTPTESNGEYELVICVDLIQQSALVTLDGYGVEATGSAQLVI